MLEEHPLITFRDGPAGRRAGLLGGPDVWEIAMWVADLAGEDDPVATLVEDSDLTRSQVDAALRYRVAYPGEITARIELHRRETAAASVHSQAPSAKSPINSSTIVSYTSRWWPRRQGSIR